MQELELSEAGDVVIDLGAASEVTLGIDDPIMKESLVMPHARDM